MISRQSLQMPGVTMGSAAPPLRGAAGVVTMPRFAAAARTNSVAIWLCMIGLIIPAADAVVYIAGAKFSAGKMSIVVLLLPALLALVERGRKLVVSDVFVCATGFWIVLAATQATGSKTMSSAVSETLELVGGYLVARAFIFGPAALREFTKVLKILAFIMLLMAISETLSGRLIVHDTVASIFGTVPPDGQYRNGVLRAMTTLDHAILYGAFSALTATILLYGESDPLKRAIYVGLCFLGCILSLSSSGLLAFVIIIAVFCYDKTMQRYPWRWPLFWSIAAVPIIGLFAVAQNPMGWIVSHLTLEPESGYFRLMIWDAASQRISESPLFGYGFSPLDSEILDATVDSVWLAFALRFGLPMIVLLMLSMITACLPVKRSRLVRAADSPMAQFATAFTLVLAMYAFIGLTVHFWNFMWMFLGICIGVRASLREWLAKEAAQRAAYDRFVWNAARMGQVSR